MNIYPQDTVSSWIPVEPRACKICESSVAYGKGAVKLLKLSDLTNHDKGGTAEIQFEVRRAWFSWKEPPKLNYSTLRAPQTEGRGPRAWKDFEGCRVSGLYTHASRRKAMKIFLPWLRSVKPYWMHGPFVWSRFFFIFIHLRKANIFWKGRGLKWCFHAIDSDSARIKSGADKIFFGCFLLKLPPRGLQNEWDW